jgi:hypothetical protein
VTGAALDAGAIALAVLMAYHTDAKRFTQCHCIVGRAVVDHDEFGAWQRGLQQWQQFLQIDGLVLGRHHDG